MDLGDGRAAIRCDDGTEVVVESGTGVDGKDGAKGDKGDEGDKGADGEDVESPCTLTDNGDGNLELRCGDTTVGLGEKGCEDGFPGSLTIGSTDAAEQLKWTMFQASACTWIRGSLAVSRDYSEAKLPSAVQRIKKIDGSLRVAESDTLKSMPDLPALESVGGDLTVHNNDVLTSMGDLPALKAVGGSLTVLDNDALESLGELSALESVGGDLYVGFNDALTSMPDLPALKSVSHALYVLSNDALTSMPDLSALDSVGGALTVGNNDALTSMGDLSALKTIGGAATISDNPKLPQCEVEAWRDGGTVTAASWTISGNDVTATCPP